jgi:hypothetical protein
MSSGVSNINKETESLAEDIKNDFLEINPDSFFDKYDIIEEIHSYHQFLSSFGVPSNYLSHDGITEDRDAIEAKRYGIDPETLDNEEYGMENDERYTNLNMNIDYEPDEYITENPASSDSESENEWIHN